MVIFAALFLLFFCFFLRPKDQITVNHILGWVWLDLSVLLVRRSLPHLGRRGYDNEGFPTCVLETFPLGTIGRKLAIILVRHKSLLFSLACLP